MSANDARTAVEQIDREAFYEAFLRDSELIRAQNAVTQNDIDAVSLNFDRYKNLLVSRSAFDVRLDDWNITNQKQSGRCWLFSSLNLLRFNIKQNLGYTEKAKTFNGGKSFELSQSYAMFWDKLERANYFLNDIISLAVQDDDPNADESLFDKSTNGELTRTAAFILNTVINDGGQWNMAVNIFNKYGVVPKEVMPETVSSSATARLNGILKALLRKAAGELSNAVHNAAGSNNGSVGLAQEIKKRVLQEVWNILCIHLGTPPREFSYAWNNGENKLEKIQGITPQDFFAKYCTLQLDEYVCLVDDPRGEHKKGATIGISHLGNVVGGSEILYINADIEIMKYLTSDVLKNGEPVWMGCDVRPHMQRAAGLWARDLFDFEGVHKAGLTTNKEDRVRFGDSAMTHAMLFTGVDFDEFGTPYRFRVENSWGDSHGDKGFYTMHENWYNEYMFEIAVHKDLLPDDYKLAYQNYLNSGRTPDITLPVWDPMGALA
jgi:bleomycin hydrolase